MLGAIPAVVHPLRRGRWMYRVLTVPLAAGVALWSSSAGVSAATLDTTSVEVSGLALSVQLTCTSSCTDEIAGSSSGDVAGLDGTNPFEVTWTSTGASNLSGAMLYTSNCDPVSNQWLLATVLSSSATVRGASLDYAGRTYPAQVTLNFTGMLTEGMFSPTTNSIDISSVGPAISIHVPVGDSGAMPMVPVGSPGVCPNGVSNFTASGIFLAAGE